jgi:POT family proton-dependent oligopeptide transporter
VLVEDVKQLFGTSGLLILFLPFIMFWALFDQMGSRWTLQASHMDGDLSIFSLMPEQMLLLSPLLSLILIPTMDQIIYPLLAQVKILTSPLPRIASGGFLVALAFCMAGVLQLQIDKRQDQTVHMAWQVPQYFIISTGAVMVIITAFEFSYSQAPGCFKSLIQAVWLLTISLGNLVTCIQSEIGGLSDSASALFLFSGLMVLSMVVFSWLAFRYTPRRMGTECQACVHMVSLGKHVKH